jgi:hypothetical protein
MRVLKERAFIPGLVHAILVEASHLHQSRRPPVLGLLLFLAVATILQLDGDVRCTALCSTDTNATISDAATGRRAR